MSLELVAYFRLDIVFELSPMPLVFVVLYCVHAKVVPPI